LPLSCTLSLPDALPISVHDAAPVRIFALRRPPRIPVPRDVAFFYRACFPIRSRPMSSQTTYLTPEGLQKLKDDLQRARTVERQEDRKSTRLNSSHVKIS